MFKTKISLELPASAYIPLLDTHCLTNEFGDLLEGIKIQQKLNLNNEMNPWQHKWKQQPKVGPENLPALDTLKYFDKDIYSIVHTLL